MIFAVDNEQDHLDLTTDSLTAAGYEVDAFTSGIEALASAEKVSPQLIVSDIDMPEMDGFQFYDAYVKKFADRNTPFLFLTAHSEVTIIMRGLDIGAEDCLQKPFLPKFLLAKVRSILDRSQ